VEDKVLAQQAKQTADLEKKNQPLPDKELHTLPAVKVTYLYL
jgi:hypothetical protein